MPKATPDKIKVVIYTPAYNKSSGMKYRVNMMSKALSKRFDVKILVDERESMLRGLYKTIGPSLLSKVWIWDGVGKSIANKIVKLRPDAAVLITDVAASAIPFLKSAGIRAFLSIEDLTPEWLSMDDPDPFNSVFCRYAEKADGAVSVSFSLKEKLLSMGIRSEIVPPGLERVLIDRDEAIGLAKIFKKCHPNLTCPGCRAPKLSPPPVAPSQIKLCIRDLKHFDSIVVRLKADKA
ncbi:MAG: hypothetical protein NO516_00025 [Candidatus Methanomethylicia archaeon]|nr:hypothetical protein [Candidatus Methanomethylicia archaeon]